MAVTHSFAGGDCYAHPVSDAPAPAPADPVPEPPRPGRPVGVHVRGTRPLRFGSLFLTLFGIAALVSQVRGTNPLPLLLLQLTVSALATTAIVVGLRWRSRDLRLWRDGKLTEGTVQRRWTRKSRNGSGWSDRHYVEYRYDVDGQTHTAKREMQWRRDGDQVWVVYDPDTPGYSMPQRM